MQESLLYKELVEPAHWVGLRKSSDLLDYLKVSSWDVQAPDLEQFLPLIKNIYMYLTKSTHLFQLHGVVSFKY